MAEITTAASIARRQGITNRQAFSAILTKQAGEFSAIAASHISPSRFLQVAVGAAMRNQLLYECEAVTVVRALLQAAELGLGVGVEQEAYLVPYKNNKRGGIYECQLLIDYRGLLKLVWQSGMVASIDFGIVYEGDEFRYRKGTDVELFHAPNFDRELPLLFWPDETNPESPSRWAMLRCVYATATTIQGGKLVVVLTRSQIERYRNMSAGKSSNFWTNHWESMAIKTALRRLCNVLPKSTSLAKAVAVDNAAETMDFSDVVFDIPEANPASEEPRSGMEAAKQSLKSKAAKELPVVTAEGEVYSGPTVREPEPDPFAEEEPQTTLI